MGTDRETRVIDLIKSKIEEFNQKDQQAIELGKEERVKFHLRKSEKEKQDNSDK